MTRPDALFFFDFIDPVSYLVARELEALEASDRSRVRWMACELRPPPTPLTSKDDPTLSFMWEGARDAAAGLGIDFNPPSLVPWTRKAHELFRHAEEKSSGGGMAMRIFEAYLLHGRDIGRVDVLVELAGAEGLDATEAKAVLDVDRFEADVATDRTHAEAFEVSVPPALIRGDDRREGFQDRHAIGTFLRT